MSIKELLLELGVKTSDASADFRNWILSRNPGWLFAEEFISAIPNRCMDVSLGDMELFYVGDEDFIMSTADDFDDKYLFSIGGLMNGCILVIDTLNNNYLSIGYVNVISGGREMPPIFRSDFYEFGVSYMEWLSSVIKLQDKNPYLGFSPFPYINGRKNPYE